MDQDALPPHPSGSGSGESSRLWEDVEMTSDELSTDSAQYICVDTNVFLQRFGTVKALYTAFTEHGQGEVKLLVPFIVINELDGLTSNHSPAPHNPQITISESARAGTHWLLEASRARTGAVRFQKWAEREDKTLEKGDDRILDCCLHFRGRTSGGRGVVLWTDDRNLALLAEANDIPTIGGPVLPLRLIDRLPVSVPSALRDHLAAAPLDAQYHGAMGREDGDGMELDLDISQIPLPAFTPIPLPSPFASSSPSPAPVPLAAQIDPSSPFPFPSPRRRGSPTKPTPPLPPSLASPIALCFIQFYNSLPLPPTFLRRTFNPSSSPFEVIKTVLRALEVLEQDSDARGAMNVELLKTISAFRILGAAIDPRVVSRRPRTGEVADALEALGGLIGKLGGAVNQHEISNLSRAVREL